MFGQPVPAVYPVFANDMHPVAFAAHRVGGDIVRDDPVASLAREFRLGVGDDVVCFGGKADQQRRSLGGFGKACEDVGIFGKRERRDDAAAVLLDLLPCRIGGAPVGDRCDHYCCINGQAGFDFGGHFDGCFDIDADDTRRGR